MARPVPARLSAAATGRRFGLTLGAAFVALAALLAWRGRMTGGGIAGALGALLLLGALLAPAALVPVERAWMALAHAISKVTTPIVMGAIYFLVITPLGILRRRFGTPTVVRSRSDASQWVAREREGRRSDLTRQF